MKTKIIWNKGGNINTGKTLNHNINKELNVKKPAEIFSFILFFVLNEEIKHMMHKIDINKRIQTISIRQIFILLASDDLLDIVFFVTPVFFGVFLKIIPII